MLTWIFPFKYLINRPCLEWLCFEGQNQINNNHDSRSREVSSVNCNSLLPRFLLTFICGKSLLWSISAAKGTSSFSQSFRTLALNYNTIQYGLEIDNILVMTYLTCCWISFSPLIWSSTGTMSVKKLRAIVLVKWMLCLNGNLLKLAIFLSCENNCVIRIGQ